MSTGSDRPQLPPNIANWRTALFQTLCASIAVVLFACLYSWWSSITPSNVTADVKTTEINSSSASATTEVKPTRVVEPILRLAEDAAADGATSPVIAASPSKMSAVTLARLSGLIVDAEEVTQNLDTLMTENKSWAAKRTALLSDDSGRRIAARDTQMELVAPAFARELPTEKQVKSWKTQLTLLVDSLTEAQRERSLSFTLDDSIETAINDLGQKVRKALDQLRRDRLLVDSVIAETTSETPAIETLQAALEARLVSEARQQAAEVEQERKQLLAEKSKQLKAKEAEKVAEESRIKELELTAQAEELNDRRRKLEAQAKADAERRKEEAAKAELEKEFQRDLPEIKRYLSGFITPGTAYREGLKGIRGPMSLSHLEREGVFQESRPGLMRMLFLAHNRNDRPPGAIPNALGGDIDWFNVPKEPLIKAQGFLIKYGKLLVEKGMLEP